MSFFSPLFLGASALLLTLCSLPAQVIVLKDGKEVVAQNMRRNGDSIMTTVKMGAGAGEIGYAVKNIEKINFPEPLGIKAANKSLMEAKAEQALREITPIVDYFAPYRDVPGSWWSRAAVLKLRALAMLKRTNEVAAMIDQLVKSDGDPEAILSARLQMASVKASKGQFKEALEEFDGIIKASTSDETLAEAWLRKGRVLLDQKVYDKAQLAFLHLPVYWPDATFFMPTAMLGSAQAYLGLEDLKRTQSTLKELLSKYPSSAEAPAAREELRKVELKIKKQKTEPKK